MFQLSGQIIIKIYTPKVIISALITHIISMMNGAKIIIADATKEI
jgi:hypothetical protein